MNAGPAIERVEDNTVCCPTYNCDVDITDEINESETSNVLIDELDTEILLVKIDELVKEPEIDKLELPIILSDTNNSFKDTKPLT